MKNIALTLSALALAGTQILMAEDPKLETTEQKAGYIIGQQIASQVKRGAGDVDKDALLAGLKAGLAGENNKFSQEEIQKVMQEMQEKRMQAQSKVAEENAAKGKAFLEENGKRKEVTTTPSGLQYEVIKEAVGAKPTKDSTVSVHYHGTLIDGTVFDSSVQRGMPTEFSVGGVIPGWTEALQLMPVGSKWKLFIPGEIAYGARGSGDVIGPNSTLIFEVELLEIKK